MLDVPTGDPIPYDASDTLFVFSFDYIDSWELSDPLVGPGGRTQGITSPIVTADGETVEVLGFPDVPPSNYPPAYILYFPYVSSESPEYYRTTIVTYSDVYGLEDDQRDACNELIRSATETVRGSLRPNPETTVDDA